MTTKKHPLDGYDYMADVPPGTPLLVTCRGEVWRLARRGIRYHSDVSTRLHGAKRARAPREFAASERLRAVINDVLRTGRDSMPDSVPDPNPVRWTDQRPGSYAQRSYLELHHGGVARAVEPIYDDAPRVAWRELTARELRRVQADLAIAPQGVHLPHVLVRERTKQVGPDSPRYEAACAAPGARPMFAGGPVEVPITQWRLIRDAIEQAEG